MKDNIDNVNKEETNLNNNNDNIENKSLHQKLKDFDKKVKKLEFSIIQFIIENNMSTHQTKGTTQKKQGTFICLDSLSLTSPGLILPR